MTGDKGFPGFAGGREGRAYMLTVGCGGQWSEAVLSLKPEPGVHLDIHAAEPILRAPLESVQSLCTQSRWLVRCPCRGIDAKEGGSAQVLDEYNSNQIKVWF